VAGPHHSTGTSVKVVWDQLTVEPSVTLIVPTRNGLSLLRVCLESVLTLTRYRNYEILVVDNGSDDPATLRYMHDLAAREPRVRIHRDDSPFNYSALNNRAAALTNSDVLVLLNNDIEAISPEWLHEMVCWAIQPGIGAVGARLWYSNRTLQHGGVIFGIGGIASHAHKHSAQREAGYHGRAQILQNFSAVTAACLCVNRENYMQVGGLDEQLAVAFNDLDFCLKLHAAGFRNIWTPHAELFHHESVSRGKDSSPAKKARLDAESQKFKSKWQKLISRDPAYNPNLTIYSEDFGLAVPPRVNLASQWFDPAPGTQSNQAG
jgi:O-antigen biosynthesis protein